MEVYKRGVEVYGLDHVEYTIPYNSIDSLIEAKGGVEYFVKVGNMNIPIRKEEFFELKALFIEWLGR